MESIFDSIENETIKIKQSEFNVLATKILESIANSYAESFQSRPLKDEDFPDESICDKCTGCGTFKLDEESVECFQDKEQGWCYYRHQDIKGFGVEVEAQMESIWGLFDIEIIPDTKQL